MTDDLTERGMRIRREILGQAHVERALAAESELDRDFQHLITAYAWGAVWGRNGLELKTRHLLTLALLAALGREPELAKHQAATANTRVTQAEIREVFMQVAVYAGVPAANSAFRIAKQVFEEPPKKGE